MAHFLFFGAPAHGHVNPSLPLTAELIAQDHHVTYYNDPSFEPQITQSGSTFRPYPAGELLQISHYGASNLVAVTRFLFEESIRLLPFVLAEIDREQPDGVIFDSIALWGMQGAALRGVPSVASISTMVQEGVKGLMHPRDYWQILPKALPLLPSIIRLRRQLVRTYGRGVFPHKEVFPCTGDTNIVYTSRLFQPDTPFVNDTFHFIGPTIRPELRPDVAFPWDWLDANRPHVYLSLGTLYNDNLPFYRIALEVIANHPAQWIISAGTPTAVAALTPVPPNCLILPRVPQLELLPRIDVFVTHGGMNSVTEGLYHNVPLVVIPQQTEQLINGRRVVQLNAGVLLGDRPPYGRVTAVELRTAVDKLLADKEYGAQAAVVGASLRTAGGVKQGVAEMLTRIVRDVNMD